MSDPTLSSPLFAHVLIQQFASAFLAILFLQSGMDKVLDWKGNLAYQVQYFSKTPLALGVPGMLGLLTVLELAAGGLSAAGVIAVLAHRGTTLAFLGAALSTGTFLCLFLGQRIAKDYSAAAGMAPYFLVGLAAMFLTAG